MPLGSQWLPKGEKQHLCNVFVANGYPKEMSEKFFHKSKAKAVSQIEKEEQKDTLYLPYIRGLSEGVERAVKDLKIRRGALEDKHRAL